MITELTAKVRLAKYIDSEGSTHQSKPFKSFTSKQIDIDTAEAFDRYLNNLTQYQTIIYGLLADSSGPRSLKNIAAIDNPWIAFDGDYIINNRDLKDKDNKPVGPITLSLKLLYSLDPQLANCKYVYRHSSSNVIVDGANRNPHKKKIWFQFKSQDQAEISKYVDTIFTRAITLHYGEYFLSESTSSFQTYLRTIFDKVVFSPERIWNEAPPKIDAGHIGHNQYSKYKEGNMVDPKALHSVTDQEYSVCRQLVTNLKHNIHEKVMARKDSLKATNPRLYHQMISAESHVLSTSLTTDDNISIPTLDIINAHLDGDTHSDLAFRDPLDPEYGANKAKLYYNDDGSIKLHSFAHGSQVYHLLIPIKDFFSIKLTDSIPEGKTLQRKEKFKGIDIIKQIIPYLYIDDLSDLEIIADELKPFGSKPTLRKLFEAAATKKTISLGDNDHMSRYALYRKSGAPWVSFDKQEGLVFVSREGMSAVMDNKVPGLSGADITKEYQMSKDRKEVDGFGMYISAPTGKLNMWAGFNAHCLSHIVTEEDISPYMEIVELMAHTPEERKAFLDWRADLIQAPLRGGGRPGYAVKGDKGTGKSFEQDLIADLFHPFNIMRVHSLDQVIGKHNAEIMHTVLIIAEEMNMGNTSYAGSKDTMKALLFSPTYRVEPKGIDAIMVPNHIHIMLSTNHAEAVIQDSDDRRWTIFQVNPIRMRDKKFFRGIQDWWDNGGKNLVFTYLSQRKYSLSDVTEGKLTDAGKEERIYGLYGLDAWLYMLLSNMREGEIINSSNSFHIDYCAWFESIYPNRTPPTVNKFGLELNKQGIMTKTSNDRILNKARGRKAFEKKFFEGKPHNWESSSNGEGDGISL